LLPRVFRESKFNEKEVLLDYKQYLPQTNSNYDYIRDRLKVLADMQHHGIPTRLMDWTTSPLVALFFACNEHISKNGKVYILNPWKLWKRIVGKPSSPDIHQIQIYSRALLADRDFASVRSIILQDFAFSIEEEMISLPFPFVSSLCNDRILSQKGCFTIHGSKKLPLNVLEEKEIQSIIIQNDHKNNILDDLRLFGVDDYSIFPDYFGMKSSFDRKGSLFNL
jgi:hypothetical protein